MAVQRSICCLSDPVTGSEREAGEDSDGERARERWSEGGRESGVGSECESNRRPVSKIKTFNVVCCSALLSLCLRAGQRLCAVCTSGICSVLCNANSISPKVMEK